MLVEWDKNDSQLVIVGKEVLIHVIYYNWLGKFRQQWTVNSDNNEQCNNEQ